MFRICEFFLVWEFSVYCVVAGQGRVDGAVCEHSEEQKMEFLRRAHDCGVVNIEMECTAISSLCQRVSREEEGGGRGEHLMAIVARTSNKGHSD